MLTDSAMADAALAAGMTAIMHGHETRWYASRGEGEPGVQLGSPWLTATTASWLRSMVSAHADGDVHQRYYEGAQLIAPITVWTGVAFMSDDTCIAVCMYALGRWTLEHARIVLGLAIPISDESQTPALAPVG